MAPKQWKKIERSVPYRKFKLFLKRLIRKELWLRPEIKCNIVEIGNWHICPDVISKSGGLVYSLGVGKDIRFGVDLIRSYALEVHAFDPNPSTVEWIKNIPMPAGFNFHPWAVTAQDGYLTLYPRIKRDGRKSTNMYTLFLTNTGKEGINVQSFALLSILKKLNHSKERLDIIKIDIEGGEYDVLDGLMDNEIFPRQILVKFHHRFGATKKRTQSIINQLRWSGYCIFFVSITGGEVSFVHSKHAIDLLDQTNAIREDHDHRLADHQKG